mgnify:CR=1 FL=1
MIHFVKLFSESVRENWALPALTNFGGITYTYGQMAEQIAKYHILFAEAGIKIVYFPYTKGISSTKITEALNAVRKDNLNDLK